MIPVYPRNIAYINPEQIIAFPGGNKKLLSVWFRFIEPRNTKIQCYKIIIPVIFMIQY